MTDRLTERLNQILPVLISDDFLRRRGLGNELAFHIFDYPPSAEIRVREHVDFLVKQVPMRRAGVNVVHVNLFSFAVEYLKDRNLLDKSLTIQSEKGDAALLKALTGPLSESKMATALAGDLPKHEFDMVLLTGVGSIWPFIRAHSLLNNMHPHFDATPVVLFFPGRYDGSQLGLFGKLPNNYYRAFTLIP